MLLFKNQCSLQPSIVAHTAHTKKNKIIHQTNSSKGKKKK